MGDDLIAAYLQEVGHRLLTKQEEVQLGYAMAHWRTTQRLIAEGYCTLSGAEAERLRDDAKAARDMLITHNLALVIALATRFPYRRLPFPDLIQQGNEGLIVAVDKFDPSKGFRFSTYATWWINHHLQRGTANTANAIRLPAYIHDRLRKLVAVQEEYIKRTGDLLTPDELAAAGFGDALKLQEYLLLVDPLSVDAPTYDGGGREVEAQGLYTLAGSQDVEEEVEAHDAAEIVSAALEEYCTPREAKVLSLYYGTDGADEHKMDAIGKRFGLTRERIRQIKDEGEAKLKAAPEMRDLWEAMAG